MFQMLIGIDMIKPSMKMGVIALIGICVIFYQYHLSTGIRFDQLTAFNAVGPLDESSNLQPGEEMVAYTRTLKVTEEMVRIELFPISISSYDTSLRTLYPIMQNHRSRSFFFLKLHQTISTSICNLFYKRKMNKYSDFYFSFILDLKNI